MQESQESGTRYERSEWWDRVTHWAEEKEELATCPGKRFDALSTRIARSRLGRTVMGEARRLCPLGEGPRMQKRLPLALLLDASLEALEGKYVDLVGLLFRDRDQGISFADVGQLGQIADRLFREWAHHIVHEADAEMRITKAIRVLHARGDIAPLDKELPGDPSEALEYRRRRIRDTYCRRGKSAPRDKRLGIWWALVHARNDEAHMNEHELDDMLSPKELFDDGLALLCLAAVRYHCQSCTAGARARLPDVRRVGPLPRRRFREVWTGHETRGFVAALGVLGVLGITAMGLVYLENKPVASATSSKAAIGPEPGTPAPDLSFLEQQCEARAANAAKETPHLRRFRLGLAGSVDASLSPATTYVDVDALAARLHQDAWDRVLVVSESGLGKSTLSKVLAAQLCREQPHTLARTLKPSDAPALSALAGDSDNIEGFLSFMARHDLTPEAQRLLASRSLTVVVDDLDSLPREARNHVAVLLQDLVAPSRRIDLVLISRPFDGLEDILERDFDTILRIPPLDRHQARQDVRAALCSGDGTPSKGAEQASCQEEGAFWRWAAHHGFDRPGRRHGVEVLAYLSNHEDIQALVDLFRGSPDAESRTKADIHQEYLLTRVRHLARISIDVDDANLLAFLDHQVDAHTEGRAVRVLTSNRLEWTKSDCTAATRATGIPQAACDHLFESHLFTPAGGTTWTLTDPAAEDFLVARKVVRLARHGAEPDPCAQVVAAMGEAALGRLAPFVVGHTSDGAQCVGAIIDTLVAHSPPGEVVGLLEPALPAEAKARAHWTRDRMQGTSRRGLSEASRSVLAALGGASGDP